MIRGKRAGIVASFFVLGLCAVSVLLVNRVFVQERTGEPDIVDEQAALFEDGYIEVKTEIVGIDPIASRMVVELTAIPHGRFSAGDDVLSVPLEIDVTDINGAAVSFQAGRRMFPHEVIINMHEGDADDYPFDSHRALLEILVLEQTAKDEWVSAPARLEFDGKHHGFQLKDQPLAPNSHNYIGFDIFIARSPLVVWTAILCMAIMWGLALVNLVILWTVLTGQMDVDLGLFGYMSGFIVATYFFRQILPDIPQYVGVYADYLSFFWVELIATVSSMIFAIIWTRNMIRPKSMRAAPGE